MIFCIGWEVGVVVNAGGEDVSEDEAGVAGVEEAGLGAELDEAGEEEDGEDDGALL